MARLVLSLTGLKLIGSLPQHDASYQLDLWCAPANTAPVFTANLPSRDVADITFGLDAATTHLCVDCYVRVPSDDPHGAHGPSEGILRIVGSGEVELAALEAGSKSVALVGPAGVHVGILELDHAELSARPARATTDIHVKTQTQL